MYIYIYIHKYIYRHIYIYIYIYIYTYIYRVMDNFVYLRYLGVQTFGGGKTMGKTMTWKWSTFLAGFPHLNLVYRWVEVVMDRWIARLRACPDPIWRHMSQLQWTSHPAIAGYRMMYGRNTHIILIQYCNRLDCQLLQHFAPVNHESRAGSALSSLSFGTRGRLHK